MQSLFRKGRVMVIGIIDWKRQEIGSQYTNQEVIAVVLAHSSGPLVQQHGEQMKNHGNKQHG